MSTSNHGNRQKHESGNPIQRALIDHFHREAVRLLAEANPGSLLDLGCGEGFTLDAFCRAGVDCEMTGIDLSEDALAFARSRLPSQIQLECANATTLADDGRTFDVVVMLEVLEHIEQPEQMFEVLERLTRRHLLLSVPWEPFFCGLNLMRGKNVRRWGNDPEHVNHWTRTGFRRWVSQRFDIVASPMVFPWTMVLATRREGT